MKKIWCILLSFCLVVGLAACGSSPAPSSSGSSGGTGAEGSDTSEPPEGPACEHDWQPATFAQPETCSKCGESRGEAKKTYMEEHGLSVLPDVPETQLPLTYVTCRSDDKTIYTTRDNGVFTISQTVEPAEEPGYKLVQVEVDIDFPLTDDRSTAGEYMTYWLNGMCDRYTGQMAENRSLEGDEGFDYESEVAVDGVTYTIRYSKYNAWSETGWEVNSDGTGLVCHKNCRQSTTILMPEDYDGLLYMLVPQFRPFGVGPDGQLEEPKEESKEDSEDKNEKKVYYAADRDADSLAGTVFIPIGAQKPLQ